MNGTFFHLRGSWRGILAGILFLAALPPACSRTAAPGGRKVILVLVDTLRRDRVGVFGSGRELTPCMDRLAREGFIFTRAVAPSSWTKPSVASLFTGLYPSRHGAVGGPRFLTGLQVLDERFATLAERFEAAGFRTAAFVTNPHVDPRYGFDQGFGRFVQPAGRAGDILEKGLDWIRREGRKGPFFLYLHLFDPHMPYAPPEPFRSRFLKGRPDKGAFFARQGSPMGIQFFCDRYARHLREGGGAPFRLDPFYEELEKSFPDLDVDVLREKVFLDFRGLDDPRLLRRSAYLRSLYDGEVAYTDACLASFVEALEKEDLLEDTLLVVTADHGEAFLEHGLWGHGMDVYAEEVDIPLLFHGPGTAGPLRGSWDGPVSLVDLLPTLLEAAGLPAPDGLDGVSLLPCMESGRASRRGKNPLFTEVFRSSGEEWSAAVSGEFEVMRACLPGRPPRWSAYDLAADPLQVRPLDVKAAGPAAAAEVRALRRTLERWIEARALDLSKGGEGPRIPEEEKDRMRALGY